MEKETNKSKGWTQNKSKQVVFILVFVISLMSLFMAYLFIIKPIVAGNIISAQQQGIEFAILSIMNQAVECQPVSLTNGNQTINLISVECLQLTP